MDVASALLRCEHLYFILDKLLCTWMLKSSSNDHRIEDQIRKLKTVAHLKSKISSYCQSHHALNEVL